MGTFSDELRHVFAGSNFQFPDIPPDLQNVNGFADCPSSSRRVRDTFARYIANADVTRYRDLARSARRSKPACSSSASPTTC